MSLDKIIVLIMSLAFFGGLGFVIWKSKRDEKRSGRASSSATPDRDEGDLSNKPQEKVRKISKP